MNFTSVLFSKEHLVSPFKMEYKNKKISVEDKKIKTIALSILMGIFTAVIGGIVFFYCLSAKYKIDKLNSNISKDQKFIRNFVMSFLHPYITGQITKETDFNDRKPMIELLKEKMPGFEPAINDEVEEMALNAFFEIAALGLYINRKKGSSSENFTSNSPEFEILINALNEAIPREFPDKKISSQDLRNKTSQALDGVNKRRKLDRLEVLNARTKINSKRIKMLGANRRNLLPILFALNLD